MPCNAALICSRRCHVLGYHLGGDAISRVEPNTCRQSLLGAFVRCTNRPRAHHGRRGCSIGDWTIFQKNKLKQWWPRHVLQAGSRYATCHFFLYVNHRQHNVHRGAICTIYVDCGISECIGNNVSARTRYTAIRQAGPRPGYPLWTQEFKARRPYLRNSI